jgi:hypothetical protein
VFAAVAAALAAVAAVVALVVVLARPGGGAREPGVDLAGRPPTDVRVADQGTSVVVSWADPTAGTASFMVTFGHAGEQLRVAATLGPGQVRHEMVALNPQLDYCFAVVAVYGPNAFAPSAQVCTSRRGGSAPPTPRR